MNINGEEQFNLYVCIINKKKNERDKMQPSREERRRRILIKIKLENGSFFYLKEYFHKKDSLKTGPFLCVNQTKLIALSLLFFSL
jgi:hypothetical protein